mmetsp:Transcript_25413/g.38612  ORF Transcript_25413/g.38612 Transcript_25413/m.38612 type:complete len:239 (+) Transcript_25413:77-793(+)
MAIAHHKHSQPCLAISSSRRKARCYCYAGVAAAIALQMVSSWAEVWSSPSFVVPKTDLAASQLHLGTTPTVGFRPSSTFLRATPEAAVEDSKSKWRFLPAWMTDPERRAKLTSMGAAGALSYLALKVLKHAVLSSLAWYLVGVRSGKNPLESWATFLSLYGSLYVAAAPFQPAKLALVAAFTPVVDRCLRSLTRRLQGRRGLAIAMIVIFIVLGGAVLWPLAVILASQMAGVPFPWQR